MLRELAPGVSVDQLREQTGARALGSRCPRRAGTMTTATRLPAESTDPAVPPRSTRPPLWMLGLGLVAVHLVVTLLVRPYPRWNDGIFVLNDARSFPDVPLDHHALRIGNLLPTRLFLDLFGYGQVAYYAWPFLTGILLIVATFALGNVLFGRWVGASAALLMVFHPVLVDTEIRPRVERMTSWQLLPDIPSAAFLTLGFALMIGAAQRRSRRRRPRRWSDVVVRRGRPVLRLGLPGARALSVRLPGHRRGPSRVAAALAPVGAGRAADARLPGPGADPGLRRPRRRAGPPARRHRARRCPAVRADPDRRPAAAAARDRGLPADHRRAGQHRAHHPWRPAPATAGACADAGLVRLGVAPADPGVRAPRTPTTSRSTPR